MIKNRLVHTLLVGFIIFSSCKSKKSIPLSPTERFSLSDTSCKVLISPETIDSQIGKIVCEGISFDYDYGIYGNMGPKTPKETFRDIFDNYYHIQFFELTKIDPKVYKIFLDSVDILDIHPISKTDNPMTDCFNCNAIANIKFKGEQYAFPFKISEKQLNGNDGNKIEFIEKNNLIYKLYQRKGQRPHLFVEPKKNTYHKKNTLSLTFPKTQWNNNHIWEYLKSIEIQLK